MSLLALVHVHDLLSVDGQVFVRVDHHAEETRVRLRETEKSFCQEVISPERKSKSTV